MNNSKPLIRLHSIFPYDRGAKARWILTELGLEFESRWIDRDAKEYESPAFLKLNPMGRVPVIEIGDQVMFESGAICAYLADRFSEGALAPSLASPERISYQQWMYFAASTLDTIMARIMVIEELPEGETRTEKETALFGELRDGLHALDLTLAKSQFLAGSRFTAADICVSYHLYWCTLWPELAAIRKEFPRVEAYCERMSKMPSAVKAEVFTYSE